MIRLIPLFLALFIVALGGIKLIQSLLNVNLKDPTARALFFGIMRKLAAVAVAALIALGGVLFVTSINP